MEKNESWKYINRDLVAFPAFRLLRNNLRETNTSYSVCILRVLKIKGQ